MSSDMEALHDRLPRQPKKLSWHCPVRDGAPEGLEVGVLKGGRRRVELIESRDSRQLFRSYRMPELRHRVRPESLGRILCGSPD